MNGRADSDTRPGKTESAQDVAAAGPTEAGQDPAPEKAEEAGTPGGFDAPDEPDKPDEGEVHEAARRARWTAAGSGGLLTLAGLCAALLRLTGAAPAVAPAAYATGAAVCALATVLGFRGRTRRALWLLIAGVMVMAVGDQFD
ncbi:hypothetical protein ACFOOM_30710 [Streptomyces echinoruber]|uniref:Uncharacterized protein n=1 Tax=Streptomyces echinoruber TaxID=68898 RepID=A0A918QZG4_9ACTN|nr:hypothetical protein [Streptomyces echinoruber]GGZ77480.1 hypothetical protein GCM10010389_14050 [Streptomyces echinoruber]